MPVTFDEQKIRQLIITASTPKQKAMYQALLGKLKAKKAQPNDGDKSSTPTSTPTPTQKLTTNPTTASPKPQPETETETETETQETSQENQSCFQAVGIIPAQVKFSEQGAKILLSQPHAQGKKLGKEYPLYYISSKRKAFTALKLATANSGNDHQRLIVYPRVLHLPKKNQPHQIGFQLIGFESERSSGGITEELQDFEFKLCGLWQFIPVCRVPCVTVQRNFSQERLAFIKQTDPAMKAKFLKASHVPLFWKDSPVKPFRFNPKLDKEQQGHPYFVEVKARFLPERNVFGFVEQLAEPMQEAPSFLKLKKEDKAKTQQKQRK